MKFVNVLMNYEALVANNNQVINQDIAFVLSKSCVESCYKEIENESDSENRSKSLKLKDVSSINSNSVLFDRDFKNLKTIFTNFFLGHYMLHSQMFMRYYYYKRIFFANSESQLTTGSNVRALLKQGNYLKMYVSAQKVYLNL